MILRACRQRANALLAVPGLRRSPSLRRCDSPDALFICDLPSFASQEQIGEAEERLTKDGWSILRSGDMWLLDITLPQPDGDPSVSAGGEAGCVLSLLRRRPEGIASPEELRQLLKVMEGPAQKRERWFRELHRELAVRLRMKRSLPGTLLPYLETELKGEL